MENIPNITDAELQIMKIIWNNSPLTAAEIIEQLGDSTNWSPKTIHTLISRLVKKNALALEKTSPFYKYSPLVSEADLRRVETKSFIQKLYNGSLHLLLSNFIKEESLTPEEIEDLKRILDDGNN